MRCPDCNKFVSYDTDVEPEEQQGVEIDSTGTLTASYRRVLTCQDCSCELKEYTFDFNESLPLDHAEGDVQQSCQHEFNDVVCDVEPTSNMKTKDRRGRPIKSARYMKQLYGVKLTGLVPCAVCGLLAEFDVEMEEQASGFEELV